MIVHPELRPFSARRLQHACHHLEVEQVGHTLHNKTVWANEERLRNVVAERSLQWEQAVIGGLQHIDRYLGACLSIRKLPVGIDAPILNDPDAA